jgi:hypothetical protein
VQHPGLSLLAEAEAVLFWGLRCGRRTAPSAHVRSKIYLYAGNEADRQSKPAAFARLKNTAGAHAGELADVQTQAKQLRKQNQALTKRIADLESRRRKLEAQPATQPSVAARSANPFDSMAVDFAAFKAKYKRASPSDDSLTWHGITLYGLVDMGVAYQNHGGQYRRHAARQVHHRAR